VDKAERKVQELCESGATILFVSHNLRQVRQLCNRALLMDKGTVVCDDDCDSVIKEYYGRVMEDEGRKAVEGIAVSIGHVESQGPLRITSVRLVGGAGSADRIIRPGTDATVMAEYEYTGEPTRASARIWFAAGNSGNPVADLDSRHYFDPDRGEILARDFQLERRGRLVFEFRPLFLNGGHYSASIFVYAEGKTLSAAHDVVSFFAVNPERPLHRKLSFWHPGSFRAESAARDQYGKRT
jgi:hypothetical protein